MVGNSVFKHPIKLPPSHMHCSPEMLWRCCEEVAYVTMQIMFIHFRLLADIFYLAQIKYSEDQPVRQSMNVEANLL